jgi:hypothetical protein
MDILPEAASESPRPDETGGNSKELRAIENANSQSSPCYEK